MGADRAAGMRPREGGGHEHIHCHVQPLSLATRSTHPEALALATYYFDGQPDAIFRERLYSMCELQADPQYGRCIQMRIYQLRHERRRGYVRLVAGRRPSSGARPTWRT